MDIKEYRERANIDGFKNDHLKLIADGIELLAKHKILRDDLTYQQYINFYSKLVQAIPQSMTPLHE